ncbi:hypothetical protein Tco_0027470 [Tanacetum coccineum]
MEDEHLSTISETELDEFIKSSVENLVQNPSESEDAFDVLESINFNSLGNYFLFGIGVESNLIESLLNRNTSIDSSSKIDSLLDEFVGELTLLKSIPHGIDDDNLDPEGEIHLVERLLYDNSSPRSSEDSNSDVSDAITESFSPSHYHQLLTDDSLSLPEHESFHFESDYDPSSPRPSVKPPNDDEIKLDTRLLTTKVDCPDSEASRARGFYPSITRASYPQLHFGNPIS